MVKYQARFLLANSHSLAPFGANVRQLASVPYYVLRQLVVGSCDCAGLGMVDKIEGVEIEDVCT